MYRRTFAEINLDNLKHNIQLLQRSFSQDTFLCVMVKANAYGHGDIPVSLYLEHLGIQHLGVCLIEEGILLREGGVKANILVFRGFDRDGAAKILEYQMTPVVSTWDQIHHLEDAAINPVSIHLKFDTGMNRLGFRPDEALQLRDHLVKSKKLKLEAILTHLLNGEDGIKHEGHTADQLESLSSICEAFKEFSFYTHALNSAGILSLLLARSQKQPNQPAHFLKNWGIRPGLMVYGYNPIGFVQNIDLKPVMSLKSQISIYRKILAGETVSYGASWKASRDSVIGVVPIGYADGYHRILSNKGEVLFLGKRAPVVGRVCMDYLMVDVTDIVGDKDLSDLVDQEVTLFGNGDFGDYLSAEELAKKAQTITWEILTSIGERVPRVYRGQDEELVRYKLGVNS